ncbi:hypothetical protein Pfo_028738 [Paulownia fortunei]|nr:hypothetical protein Pfo_028738 [Paulownia fortunei]
MLKPRTQVGLVVTSLYHDGPAVVSSLRREHGALAVARQSENTKDVASAGEWVDSLANISVGDLLSESTDNMDFNCTQFPLHVGSNSLQQIPFSCDSFDAAIAAHVNKHQNKSDLQQSVASHGPSIWDAEETRDAFSFQKNGAFCDRATELLEEEKLKNINPTCGDMMEDPRSDHSSENSSKDFGGLTDIYWPDSLGPLDLDIPSCRYNSDDLILSDSLGGLNRLIANSLDGFQNCSFSWVGQERTCSNS